MHEPTGATPLDIGDLHIDRPRDDSTWTESKRSMLKRLPDRDRSYFEAMKYGHGIISAVSKLSNGLSLF